MTATQQHSPMRMSWAETVAASLIGTDRRPTGSADPAADVLDAAATRTAYQRAGFRPPTHGIAVEAAPTETLPTVSTAAAARLALLLDSSNGALDYSVRDEVLLEWLDLAATRQLRVRPAQLPALLECGRSRTDIRSLIVRVSGARGRWLAGQNPDWRYLDRVAGDSRADEQNQPSEPPELTLWTMGTQGERVEYFRALRRHDCAAGRELLEQQWSSTAPDERADLVRATEIGLDALDEAVLERALDDRRREVREAASALLQRLPGSAYAIRAAQRGKQCLMLESGTVRVTPPVECDPSMRRDGVAVKPPSGKGERAWWLEEVLARAPLSTWGTPATFTAQVLPSEWASTVYRGLGRAAATQREPLWAVAMLDLLGESDSGVTQALYPVLPPDELTHRTIATLRSQSTHRWVLMIDACPTPWPDALSRAVLDGIQALANQSGVTREFVLVTQLACVCLPSTLAAHARELADSSAEGDNHAHDGWLQMLAAVLSFRAEMTEELR